MGLMGVFRRRWQRLAIVSIIFCMVSLSIVSSREDKHDVQPHSDFEARHPLLYKHIHMSDVKGGGTFWLFFACCTLFSTVLTLFSNSVLHPSYLDVGVGPGTHYDYRSRTTLVPAD
jgi:hypothetical protein